MRCVLATSIRHLMWRIRTLVIISTVLVLGSTPVFARGGGTLEDMEVATRAAIVVTLVATKDRMEVMPEISTDGLQTEQQRGVT
jgi:hypothetical protein